MSVTEAGLCIVGVLFFVWVGYNVYRAAQTVESLLEEDGEQ